MKKSTWVVPDWAQDNGIMIGFILGLVVVGLL